MTIKLDQNIIKKEVTIGTGKANIYGLLFLIPIIITLGIPYYYIWSEQFTIGRMKGYLERRDALTYIDIILGIVILIFGIMAHELLHGLGWSNYTKNGWKSIAFGINWKFLTPYCHCKEPLSMNNYRIGSGLPAVVLGFIPSITAIILGNLGLMVFGFFFTFAAGGDFLILWLLRKENSNDLVKDHSDKIGCLILKKKQ